MRRLLVVLVFAGYCLAGAQPRVSYVISFDNAVHHEAVVTATFSGLPAGTVEARMSRSSPGRYALHEFAKNVYSVTAVDGNGKVLAITRPNPYEWDITGHNGTVAVTYTVYGDHPDGTYLGVDETHAHINMPATFMYTFSFNRNRLAYGAASAVIMFLAVMAIIIPYLYSELRGTRNER